ncbi:MepB family protein [Enterococcus sp. AZ072]|uniref:MepB family protein n=1 Tax=unclassified Enterococcus TaxID=2608891 RepID=UPI003D265868
MNTSLSYLHKLLNKFPIENLQSENQNQDYEGTIFSMNSVSFRSRLAKSTPKKKGYFVAFWEKDSEGKNQPFSYFDSPEKLIIVILDGQRSGQFVFPKDILLKNGILKGPNSKGKMSIRVYPIWEQDLNKTAFTTKKWQTEFFIDTSASTDIEKISAFYYE